MKKRRIFQLGKKRLCRQIDFLTNRIATLFDQMGTCRAQRQEALYELYHGEPKEQGSSKKYARPTQGHRLVAAVEQHDKTSNLVITINQASLTKCDAISQTIDPAPNDKEKNRTEFIKKYRKRVVNKNQAFTLMEQEEADTLVVEDDLFNE